MNRPCVWWCLLLSIGLTAPPATAGFLYFDPRGDTFGVGPVQHDIVQVSGGIGAGELTVTVLFAGPIAPPSGGLVNPADPLLLEAFLDLDVDRNPATGVPSVLLPPFGLGGPVPGLGVEFRVDLGAEAFHPGFAELVDTGTNTAALIPVTFDPTGFTVTVPLGLIGGTGEVNFGVLAGTLATEPTDQAANPGQPVFTVPRDSANPVPEPASLVLLVAGLPFALRLRRR